ncbi:MAG: hypothetical protein ACHP83_07645 [Burkholderiales bacterium]|jgi:CubicO group peptidase (beta-lactamase class C family)
MDRLAVMPTRSDFSAVHAAMQRYVDQQIEPSAIDPARSTGELQWGGVAGTHWWIAPRANLAALVMTQRQMAFWHPFSFEFKRLAHRAVGL